MNYINIFSLVIMLGTSLSGISQSGKPFLLKSIETEFPVIAADYSADGIYLVSGGGAKTVDVWNAKTGELVKSLQGHTDEILCVRNSPTKRFVASAGVDKTLKIWDIETGTLISTFNGHTDYIRDIAFSPDGKTICSASWDGTAIIWDVLSGTKLQILSSHRDNVTSVAFNQSGDQVITSCGDHFLRVWDVETGKMLKMLIGHTDEIWDVKWSSNGRFAASGAWDNKVRVWDVEEGAQVMELPGHTTDVWSVGFDPDVTMLVTSGGDRKVKLWDLAMGELIIDLSGNVHTSDVEEVSFSPDGKEIVSASRDGSIRIWQTPDLAERIGIITRSRMREWSKKQINEEAKDYNNRMGKRDKYAEQITAKVVSQILTYYIDNVDWQKDMELGDYFPDQEHFKLKSSKFGVLKLKVPKKFAIPFKDNFSEVTYNDLRLSFQEGKVRVVSLTTTVDGISKKFTASSF